ncbi:MAG TPA: hypothetical protein VK457_22205, partial [Chloroflexota bacterium]|nr:hypothetical protein [Chloroflexota bacterium]
HPLLIGFGTARDVVGISPNPLVVIRMVGAVVAEHHDEWVAWRRSLRVSRCSKFKPSSETD